MRIQGACSTLSLKNYGALYGVAKDRRYQGSPKWESTKNTQNLPFGVTWNDGEFLMIKSK